MRRNWNLAATLTLLMAMANYGCGKPGGASPDAGQSGSTGLGASTTAKASGLQSAVEAKLKANSELADVKVSEQNGSIQLDGTVKDSASKDNAEKMVMDVEKEQKSQVGVLNNLQIKEGAAK